MVRSLSLLPEDNFGNVVGEDPTPYVILTSWAVNGIVCSAVILSEMIWKTLGQNDK